MELPPPVVLNTPLFVPEKLLMGPGPSNCSPRVLRALSQPVLGHLHIETTKIMDEIKEGIKYVFQTKNTLTLAVSASGHGGMEAVLSNLLEPGDRVLVAINGIWGQRAASMAKRYGASVASMLATPGNNFSLEEFEEAIKLYQPDLLFVTQGESSTGVYQPVDDLGHLCHKYNCLLAVDTVASLGGVPMFADRWGVDAIYTGSQKALGAPPGLAPISFSPKAQERIFNRKTPVAVFYWDMTILGDYWACFGRPRVYHHTISTTLLYGLREGLAIIAQEGLENVILRHQQCARRLHKGLENMGLELFAREPANRLPTVTAIKVPEGVNWTQVITHIMQEWKLEISGGLGPTYGKVFRIGLMGHNATFDKVDLTLRALKDTLALFKDRNSKL